MHTPLLLDMAADALGDRTALGSTGEGLTFEGLRLCARRAAAWMCRQPGDKIVYLGLGGAAVPLALFASGYADRPFTPLNYRLADADLRVLLARTAPSTAIVDDDMLPRVAGIEGVALVARSAFEAAARADGRELALAECDPDIAILLFTSGTTGQPKAAVLRHRHLASYVVSTVEFAGAGAEEAALIAVPPYHIAGISAVLTGLYAGRRLVYLPAFTPEHWVDAMTAEGITHAMVVPTMLGRVLDVLERRGQTLPSLRALSYGGGRMPLAVIERAMRLLPQVGFVNAYGLTETSSTIAILDPEDHRHAFRSTDPAVRRRLGSVGRPLPALELEIRDPNGECLPSGASGEIWVRGEQVSGEYLGRKTIRADGWFPTNDGGWLDDEGYLFVEGRLDDVIVRGGENISPGEIEDVLRSHPGIRDAAVFGMPDEEWGEKIVAVVVADGAAPAGELKTWVGARLRSTKVPQEIGFRSELPYNDTGKLLRRVLKSQMAEASPVVPRDVART